MREERAWRRTSQARQGTRKDKGEERNGDVHKERQEKSKEARGLGERERGQGGEIMGTGAARHMHDDADPHADIMRAGGRSEGHFLRIHHGYEYMSDTARR